MVSRSEALLSSLLMSSRMKRLGTLLRQFLEFLLSSTRVPVSTMAKSACTKRYEALDFPLSTSA